jgi:hypothetical protein
MMNKLRGRLNRPQEEAEMRTTIKLFFSVCLSMTLATFSLFSLAHHSAAQYDFSQMVPVTGKVKHIEISNPHIDLVLEITDADGSTREVQYEGHSRNNVYRRGWRPDAIMEGDTITIYIAPLREGGVGGYIQQFELADGRTF